MFSKELENLIKATLEDGVLEDYEKAALVKRAEAEGVDLTELEIYINSLLQRRKRELEKQQNAEFAAKEKHRKEEFGKICPACGRQVQSLTLVCECGYEFKTERRVSSVKVLSEKIDKIQSRPLNGIPNSIEWLADKKQRDQEVLDAITIFPVPNTKEDIMEFLAWAAPNAKFKGGILGTIQNRLMIFGIIALLLILPSASEGPEAFFGCLVFAIIFVVAGSLLLDRDTLSWNKKARVWRAKFDQVMMKARSLRVDADFSNMLDYYENQLKK